MEKRKVGRPKSKNPKNCRIAFRVSPKEELALRELSKETGKSMSDFIRSVVKTECCKFMEAKWNGDNL